MRKYIIIGLFLFVTSCVTSKITSNKSPNFNEKISKLYVMVKGTDSAKPFFYSFTDELGLSLKAKAVESMVKYIDPLSLESDSDINQAINDYGSNLIMIINQTESRTTINNGYGWGFNGTNTGGTFDVQIFQPNSKNPVWRANLKADGQFGLKSSAKKACEKLIEKLIQDYLF